MPFYADLHIHSRFSRACSRDLNLPQLWRWAQLKGLALLGSGDFTHPAWLAELQESLEPAENGVYRLRRKLQDDTVPASCRGEIRFLLQTEVSCIWRQGDRTRKVHLLVLMPDFTAVTRFNRSLAAIGNLAADGRPILGLSAADLLSLALEASPEALVIPAHAWTPHFSVFGATSGFTSLEECFGDLAGQIPAIETGLSSDPAMNALVSALDSVALISCSDAHSPAKLGREATIFATEIDFPAIGRALWSREGLAGTVEFFPEEGKYYADGHRQCNVCLEPAASRRQGGLCPVCGQPLTTGVLHRVLELADRPAPAHTPPFCAAIPLVELLAEATGVGVTSKRVQTGYHRLLAELGPELPLLLELPLADIERLAGTRLAGGIDRMRRGEVLRQPGYDGRYGSIRVFADHSD